MTSGPSALHSGNSRNTGEQIEKNIFKSSYRNILLPDVENCTNGSSNVGVVPREMEQR